MSEVLEVDELTFDVRRSKRRTTVGVTVERNASLVLHLPEDFPLPEAEPLVRSKLVWVHQKLINKQKAPSEGIFRRPEFVDGEGFYFLGRHYRMKLVDPAPEEGPVETVRFVGDLLLFRRDQVVAGPKRIADYYTRAAHPYINQAVDKWKRVTATTPAKFVSVLDLGFRWGSCSADGTLNFHWRVMQLPPPVIDYVVVHELCHLKVGDHSSAFWGEVRHALPDYQRHRAWLRDRGGRL
jgi:predicted metal-dependent hydrolase